MCRRSDLANLEPNREPDDQPHSSPKCVFARDIVELEHSLCTFRPAEVISPLRSSANTTGVLCWSNAADACSCIAHREPDSQPVRLAHNQPDELTDSQPHGQPHRIAEREPK